MFLFDLLFGRRKPRGTAAAQPAKVPAPEAVGATAPGTLIRHDPALVAALKQDHQLLLEIFGSIRNAAAAGDLRAVQKRLEHFRIVLQDHLLKENVRLYVYLEHLLRSDPTSHELMHGFRHEMDAIGKTVVGFLGRYKFIAGEPALAASFGAELDAIGQALAARIRREEDTLYPMYRPPA